MLNNLDCAIAEIAYVGIATIVAYGRVSKIYYNGVHCRDCTVSRFIAAHAYDIATVDNGIISIFEINNMAA